MWFTLGFWNHTILNWNRGFWAEHRCWDSSGHPTAPSFWNIQKQLTQEPYPTTLLYTVYLFITVNTSLFTHCYLIVTHLFFFPKRHLFNKNRNINIKTQRYISITFTPAGQRQTQGSQPLHPMMKKKTFGASFPVMSSSVKSPGPVPSVTLNLSIHQEW